MGVCEPLMPDVMASKAHQNNCSYVSSPSDSICENLAWWAVTWRTLKNHETVKIGGWVLARDNAVIENNFLGEHDLCFESHSVDMVNWVHAIC